MNTTANLSGRWHSQAPALRTCALLAFVGLAFSGLAPAQLVDINSWRQSNEFRAMALQRELSADMPQNQSLMLGSHNTFNASNYPAGYLIAQHSYTITEQLHLGLRQIDLDVHDIPQFPDNLLISHADCTGIGYTVGDMSLADALFEIRTWLLQNPGEVVIIHTEQHFRTANTHKRGEFLRAIELIFGNLSSNDILIRPSDLGSYSGQQMAVLTSVSLNQLRSFGRILFTNIGGASEPCSNHYIEDFPVQDIIFGNGPGSNHCDQAPSLREQRYYYYVHARDFDHDWGSDDVNENGVDDVVDIDRWRSNPNTYRSNPDVNGNNVIDYYEQQYWDVQCIGARASECPDQDSFYSMLYSNTSCLEYRRYGSPGPNATREAVRAGMDVIRFDPLGSSSAQCGTIHTQPADEHMRATIWSWDYRYLPYADGTPMAAMAVIEGDTARLRWEHPTVAMRYALQSSTGEWSISSASGTFAAAPAEVVGGENFRVPGNGFEMQNLFGYMVRAGITKVWVNYHDLDGNGAWQQRTQPREFWGLRSNRYLVNPRAAVSPFPSVVVNALQLAAVNSWETPTFGRVVGLYPGIYAAFPTAPIVLNKPMTIVPAAHGIPVSLGR